MTDNRTARSRSALMAKVRSRHTAPEIEVRRLLHGLGYRFRLHSKRLPGRPDIVFPARRKAVLVHGCFWHAHGCKLGRAPKSRPEFWEPKLARNRARDGEIVAALEALEWDVLTVWQCQIKDRPALAERMIAFLGPPGTKFPIDTPLPDS